MNAQTKRSVSNDEGSPPPPALSRRAVLAASGVVGMGAAAKAEAAAPRRTKGTAPSGFLWGTAISAHQSEGNNVNSDSWLLENISPTVFKEPSGDACDSYNRYEEDIALAAGLGFNSHRMGIEWARIEPEPGVFSVAQLDHYERMLEACHKRGLAPMVTFNHFTVPRWFATRGGFEVADGADLFARFAERTTARLGSLMAAATPFNEGNIALLLRLLPEREKTKVTAQAMIAAAAKASGSERFSTVLFGDPDKLTPVMLDAHAKAYQAIKAGPGDFPVGVSLTMQHVEGVGDNNPAEFLRTMLYGGWIEAAKKSDFIGVQTYTRIRVSAKGVLPPPEGAELTAAGYEFRPQALGGTIRFAAQATGKPVYVTESGLATNDDTRRIAFIDQALAEVRACLDEGIDVRSYILWSLLDNYEWTSGYGQHFGMVSVDRQTFKRTPKPSARYLGDRARAGRL
jgi:beta-glucosidase